MCDDHDRQGLKLQISKLDNWRFSVSDRCLNLPLETKAIGRTKRKTGQLSIWGGGKLRLDLSASNNRIESMLLCALFLINYLISPTSVHFLIDLYAAESRAEDLVRLFVYNFDKIIILILANVEIIRLNGRS